MNAPFNQLTPAQAERLALLAEECAEVIHIIGKILRHGYDSTHPANPTGPDNRATLQREVGDLYAALTLLYAEGDISAVAVQDAAHRKCDRVGAYLHHQDLLP